MILKYKKCIEKSPTLTIKKVWDEFTHKATNESNALQRMISDRVERIGPKASQSILNDLQDTENQSLRQNNRLTLIRKRIMDLVDKKMGAQCLLGTQIDNCQNEKHSSTVDKFESLDRVLSDCDLQIELLRIYAYGKYEDGHKNDWFQAYTYLSAHYHQKMISGLAANHNDFFFDGRYLSSSAKNFQECKMKCLNANIGQEFITPASENHLWQNLGIMIRRHFCWKRIFR